METMADSVDIDAGKVIERLQSQIGRMSVETAALQVALEDMRRERDQLRAQLGAVARAQESEHVMDSEDEA